MAKRVCISIAVSTPERLDPLPGAIQAAKDVVDWAAAAGFDTHLYVSDQDGLPVTAARLNAALMPILGNPADEIDHLVIHFAGHGVAIDAEDQFLLLNNWRTKPDEAIRLSRFVRLLQYYQPKRVSLFIDACRSRPTSDADDLNGSGILDRPDEEPVEFLQDRFRAAVHAREAYMIRGSGGQPSRCFFTTLLLKALCGAYPDAITTRGNDKVVTSGLIYFALTQNVAGEMALYHVKQELSLHPGFVTPDDVYTRLPIGFAAPVLPPPQSATTELRGDRAEEIGVAHFQRRLDWKSDRMSLGISPDAFEQAAQERRARYRDEELPTHFETGSGLVVNGARVRGTPVIGEPARIERDRRTDRSEWWRVSFPDFRQGPASNVAIELDDGSWIGATVLPRKISAITVGERREDSRPRRRLVPIRGAVSTIYRPAASQIPGDAALLASDASESFVARLGVGALSGDDALKVAVRIRSGDFLDPMLGAIAAHLYEAIGDRAGIRRLASLFARSGEPIPFDIALLADLRGRREGGRLRAVVPAVERREPETVEEDHHPELFGAAPQIADAPVAGGFPWLRQGWALLDTVRLPVHPTVVELAGSLLPLPFTTLKPEAGRVLADLIRRGKV